MSGNIQKPKPLKVFGRSHYACTRCKVSKIKCSGERPACANCKSINKGDACVYPTKDRKIVIMESDLNKLHDRVEYLESIIASSNPSHTTEPERAPLNTTTVGTSASHSYPSMSTIGSTKKIPVSGNVINGIELVNFYAPEFDDYDLQYNLLLACQNKLPERTYALNLVNKVYFTYNQEFYLLAIQEFLDLTNDIYALFDGLQQEQQQQTSGQPQTHQNSEPPLRSITQISLCYFFILIAFGEQLLNVKTDENKYPGMEYYLLAEHLFRLTRSDLDITFMQSSLLLGLYSVNLARYNIAYNYLGIAARSAVAQGYHRQRDIPGNKSPEEYRELRIFAERSKRLWWTIFVIDSLWAAKTENFQYTDTDVDLPTENTFDLGDSFDGTILETNVHLTKYVTKFVRLIYGPNIRTFSVNYINTNQFNQKLLLKNILTSSSDLIKNFEFPLLSKFRGIDYVNDGSRMLANLLLRYHQLNILLTKPLLSLATDPSSSELLENYHDIEATIAKGMFVSCSTIDIVARLYTCQKIFVLGYWDSHHLFSSLMMLIIAGLRGKVYPQVNKAIALLKYLAGMGNINANTYVKKLNDISYELQCSGIAFKLDLSVTVDTIDFDKNDYYKNPPSTKPQSNYLFEARTAVPYLPEAYADTIEGINTFLSSSHGISINDKSRDFYMSIINHIQGWEN
ncbi:zinc-finger protein [Spathaspora passalidarum NRRL Y-27907]|uniref:Zinc-finger protein n=1 Tax=Spathaspora passalidarum (strain NRRL Y-27907 / 11-Y1) TaxID=619300 RepID=G3AFH0_SPAPN|nr:zinc-finger protein [Spathaspora passalidarum NRRL Y-27907]EGW34959.1 zinc-finger protein [Spathaspora passalidarum NRRL Y-27907]